MSGGPFPSRWALALALLAVDCAQKPTRRYVEAVEINGDTATDNAVTGLAPTQVQAELEQRLRAHARFLLPVEGKNAPSQAKPLRLALTLEFTREAQKQGRAGIWAEVGATLKMTSPGSEGLPPYDLVGLGEVKVQGDAPAQHQGAVREALGHALDQLVESADLQLAASDKPDDRLLKDLSSTDGRVREFALRVLVERKNPAAAGPLIAKLHSDDLDEVRRTLGQLVELKATAAVPTLIDLSPGIDPGFLRELLFALGSIGGEEAEAYLYTVSQGHNIPEIRATAEQALNELRTRQTRAKRP